MPYFKWNGVDISGALKRGKLAAYSKNELSERLFRQGVALLKCRTTHIPLLLYPISMFQKAELLRHVAKLMHAGILLPNALEIAAQQASNPVLHDIFFTFSRDMQKGVPFSTALKRQKKIADAIMSTMLIAGNESGSLIKAFEYCASYCETQAAFKKNVRAAIAMPLLTFLFFMVVSSFIFISIIPRFADMFGSLNHQLPLLTQRMIYISDCMRSPKMIMFVGVMACMAVAARYYCKTVGKSNYDLFIISLPLIGNMVYHHHLQQLFQALSLLTHNGITLSSALETVASSENNYVIKRQLDDVSHAIQSGQLLSDAMMSSSLFLPEIIAVIRIGEESGTLGQSLEYAATLYSDKIHTYMRRITVLLQPTIIVLLGCLIMIVIFSVYLPIMELSRVI